MRDGPHLPVGRSAAGPRQRPGVVPDTGDRAPDPHPARSPQHDDADPTRGRHRGGRGGVAAGRGRVADLRTLRLRPRLLVVRTGTSTPTSSGSSTRRSGRSSWSTPTSSYPWRRRCSLASRRVDPAPSNGRTGSSGSAPAPTPSPATTPSRGTGSSTSTPTAYPTAFAVYEPKDRWTGMRPENQIEVHDDVTVDDIARARAVALPDRRRPRRRRWSGPGTRATRSATTSPTGGPCAQTGQWDHIWARLLDVPAALTARAYATADRVVVEVVDAFLGRGGRFVLDAGPDGASCTPTSESAEVTLPVAALGAAWFGGTTRCRDRGASTSTSPARWSG